jgi:MOSC domain-containing protein YiiM
VNGGPDKAVYAYSVEHYKYRHSVFPDLAMPNGMFGENLTVEGLIDWDSKNTIRFVQIFDNHYEQCFSSSVNEMKY